MAETKADISKAYYKLAHKVGGPVAMPLELS